jgi:hypothetical protein
VLPSKAGLDLHGDLFVPATPRPHPAVILLVPDSIPGDTVIARANKARFDRLTAEGNVVLAIMPRPSPPGQEEMKSSMQGTDESGRWFHIFGIDNRRGLADGHGELSAPHIHRVAEQIEQPVQFRKRETKNKVLGR